MLEGSEADTELIFLAMMEIRLHSAFELSKEEDEVVKRGSMDIFWLKFTIFSHSLGGVFLVSVFLWASVLP
jgi:hypothetical protein